MVDLKTIIKMNAIWDNLVTKPNIKLMECLYGFDIPTIKGKATRQHLHKLVSNVVSIPHELCDSQYDVSILTSCMSMVCLSSLQYPRILSFANLVESVHKLYSRVSFQVTEVCANHNFKPVLHVLQDSGWSFMTNLANTQEHVPEGEHNNCVLKEHICTTYHGIPYKMLPRATW